MPTDNTLKSLWEALPHDPVHFSSAEMRLRAEKLAAKVRTRNLVDYASFGILILLIIYIVLAQRRDWVVWVSAVLALVGSCVAMINLHVRSSVKKTPSAMSGQSLLTFHKSELTRQRDAAKSAWKWYLLPLAPTPIFVVVARWIQGGDTLTSLTDARMSILLVGLLCVSVFTASLFWLFLRAARFQRQLDVLESYEVE